MRGRAASPVLVGRRAELAQVEGVLDEVAESGRAGVVLVVGDAGVGKSRLVAEVAVRAPSRGFRVAVGRCVEFGDEIWPLAPMREILAGFAEGLDTEMLGHVIGGSADVLGRLVPSVWTDRADPTSAVGAQAGRAMVGVLQRLAQRGPLLLVIEDLHWADSSTRTLFSLLTHAGGLGAMAIVGTYRGDELHRQHPLRPVLAEIVRGARSERVELRPLDRTGTAELIAAIGTVAVDDALVDDVHRLSEGYPFFVEELVAARAAGVTGLPDTLREVILARSSALDDSALRVLQIAAATTGGILPDVLGAACGLDGATLRGTVDTLVAAALLVPVGDELQFRHELARAVFYDELGAGERADVHARLASNLEVLRPERPGEIARHWLAAHDESRGLAACVAAGRHALASGAAAEAEGHLERALALWPRVEHASAVVGSDHVAVLMEASLAARYARHLDVAIEYAALAASELEGVDPQREGQVWLELRELYRFDDNWDRRAHAVERALALIPSTPPSSARAWALAHAAIEQYHANNPSGTLAYAEQSAAIADAVDDPNAAVYARHAVGRALSLTGTREQVLAHRRATVALCGPDVPAELTIECLSALADVLADLAQHAELASVGERGVEIARSTGLGGPRSVWMAIDWVDALVQLGRWAEAERVVTGVRDLLSPADEAQSWGLVLLRQGRIDEARLLLEPLRSLLAAPFWTADLAYMGAAVVEYDIVEGHYDDIALRAFAADLIDRSFTHDGHPHHGHGAAQLIAAAVRALADRAQLARTQRRPEAIAPLADAAAGWIERLDRLAPPAWRPGVEDRLLLDQARAEFARLGGGPDAGEWTRLAAQWRALGVPYHEAYTRWRAAEGHLAGTAGRSAAARRAATAELADARVIAVDLRAYPLLADIDTLARRARLQLDSATPAPLAPTPQHDAFDLTARERDVLVLLAAGRSNGQIGRELFISTKTASVHVSHILGKLGVHNRVEAAAVAHEHHLDQAPVRGLLG